MRDLVMPALMLLLLVGLALYLAANVSMGVERSS